MLPLRHLLVRSFVAAAERRIGAQRKQITSQWLPCAQRFCTATSEAVGAQQVDSDGDDDSQHVLMSFGEGFLGNLGHGDFKPSPEPRVVAELANQNIVQIAAGWGHSMALDDEGTMFLFGRTHDFGNTLRLIMMHNMMPRFVGLMNWIGQGRNLAALDPAVLPVEGEEDLRFVRIAASVGALSAAVTEDGRIFAMGSNEFGECGGGHTERNVWKWQHVLGTEEYNVVDVQLGYAHGVALSDEGTVLTWGKGERGQVGLGDRFWYKQAVPVLGDDGELEDKVVAKISANFNTSALITEDGDAYIWGKLQGEGVDPEKGIQNDAVSPRRVEIPGRVVDVACGIAHVTYLTDDGKLWMTGMEERGLSFDRSVLEDADADVAAMEPMPGVLDLPNTVREQPVEVTPGPLAGRSIVALRTDQHHTYAITEVDDNDHAHGKANDSASDAGSNVFWWGWNRRPAPYTPVAGHKVVDMAPGLLHTLIVVKQGALAS